MMRALFSAISGMKNHMAFMDVVGNNIANVNTIAFKSSRVTFQDILGQTIRGASSPQGDRGGMNPAQVGLGMQLGGIDNIMTQGFLQSTGKLTDFAIQGDGFFVVSDGTRNYYTRDGAFDIDVAGNLVNPVTGLKVMGWRADASGAIDVEGPLVPLSIPFGDLVSFAVGSTGEITGIYSNGDNRVIGQLALAAFTNPGGLQRQGQNLWSHSANSGEPRIGQPNTNGLGSVSTGTLESSNVDLAQQFTSVILAQRGFQSSSRVITAGDQMLQDLVNIIR